MAGAEDSVAMFGINVQLPLISETKRSWAHSIESQSCLMLSAFSEGSRTDWSARGKVHTEFLSVAESERVELLVAW